MISIRSCADRAALLFSFVSRFMDHTGTAISLDAPVFYQEVRQAALVPQPRVDKVRMGAKGAEKHAAFCCPLHPKVLQFINR